MITYGVDYSGARIGEGTEKAGMEQPVYYWDPVIAPSGMVVLHRRRVPRLEGQPAGRLDAAGALVRLMLENGRVASEERYLGDLGERIRDVQQGPDGLLYLLTDSATGGCCGCCRRRPARRWRGPHLSRPTATVRRHTCGDHAAEGPISEVFPSAFLSHMLSLLGSASDATIDPSPNSLPKGGDAKPIHVAGQAWSLPLCPLGKGHAAPRACRGAVAGHIVKDFHFQVLHRPCGGDPVADLRAARLETFQRQRCDGVDVFVLERLEYLAIQLLIDHEMAEPARAKDRDPRLALPGFNGVPERDPEVIGPPWPRLIGRIVGVLHDRHHGDALPRMMRAYTKVTAWVIDWPSCRYLEWATSKPCSIMESIMWRANSGWPGYCLGSFG